MKTFAIATLGCKVNSVESDRYIQIMEQGDYQQVDFKDKADLYIINTCAVTNAAAAKSRQRIAQAQRLNPKAQIVVVGCSVAADFDNLSKFKNIEAFISQDEKADFDRIVLKKELMNTLAATKQSKTRAFLKIQDGCEQFCSFCVIPIARGPETSVQLDELVTTTQQLVAAGHQEIVLTGIHIGKYGMKDESSLLELLKELVCIDGLQRIRISSIEITELHDDLLEFMANEPKIAKHLHIPLQSGSDVVLKAMNRPYDMAYFFKRVAKIRTLMPDIMISSDVIAGFVNESEAQFQETIANIEALEFGFLHVFPYSKRKQTKAMQMKHHLPGDVIKARTQTLLAVSKACRTKYYQSYVDKNVSVLLERHHKGGMFGYSEHYLPVVVKDYKCDGNQFVDVTITHTTDTMCYGVLK